MKKNIPKKNKFISRETNIFPAMLILGLFFRRPH